MLGGEQALGAEKTVAEQIHVQRGSPAGSPRYSLHGSRANSRIRRSPRPNCSTVRGAIGTSSPFGGQGSRARSVASGDLQRTRTFTPARPGYIRYASIPRRLRRKIPMSQQAGLRRVLPFVVRRLPPRAALARRQGLRVHGARHRRGPRARRRCVELAGKVVTPTFEIGDGHVHRQLPPAESARCVGPARKVGHFHGSYRFLSVICCSHGRTLGHSARRGLPGRHRAHRLQQGARRRAARRQGRAPVARAAGRPRGVARARSGGDAAPRSPGPYPYAEVAGRASIAAEPGAVPSRADLEASLAGVEEIVERRLRLVSLLAKGVVALGWSAPVVVGGFAVQYYTAGDYRTLDIDLVGASEPVAQVLESWGFLREGRHWYDAELKFAVEVPGAQLEIGRARPRLRRARGRDRRLHPRRRGPHHRPARGMRSLERCRVMPLGESRWS